MPAVEGWDHGIYPTSGERLLNAPLCCKGLRTGRGGQYDSAPRLPVEYGKGDFADYLVQVCSHGTV